MAFQNDTAMGHTDFYNRMLDFLQNDPTLTGLGQNWTEVWTAQPTDPNPTARVLAGPGLAGQDQVFVGVELFEDIPAGQYELRFRGMTGIIPSATQISEHINVSPESRVFLNLSPFEYWIVANGRRFVIACQISTVVETGYFGLILPYAQPPSYPYPCLIGGTAGSVDSPVQDFRSIAGSHTDYLHPSVDSISNILIGSNAHLIDPAGAWRDLAVRQPGVEESLVFPRIMVHPYEGGRETTLLNNPDSSETLRRQISAYGGDFVTQPVTLFSEQPTQQVYGILDGVFAVQGIGNSNQNILTVDGVDHLTLQNTFRSETNQFHAVALG